MASRRDAMGKSRGILLGAWVTACGNWRHGWGNVAPESRRTTGPSAEEEPVSLLLLFRKQIVKIN